jgi:hypothetical protein
MAVGGWVELLLITDYVYDVGSSSDHEFRFNDNILQALITASRCSKTSVRWKTVTNIYGCHTRGKVEGSVAEEVVGSFPNS